MRGSASIISAHIQAIRELEHVCDTGLLALATKHDTLPVEHVSYQPMNQWRWMGKGLAALRECEGDGATVCVDLHAQLVAKLAEIGARLAISCAALADHGLVADLADLQHVGPVGRDELREHAIEPLARQPIEARGHLCGLLWVSIAQELHAVAEQVRVNPRGRAAALELLGKVEIVEVGFGELLCAFVFIDLVGFQTVARQWIFGWA